MKHMSPFEHYIEQLYCSLEEAAEQTVYLYSLGARQALDRVHNDDMIYKLIELTLCDRRSRLTIDENNL